MQLITSCIETEPGSRADRPARPTVDNGRVSPAPDAAQRDAAHQLQLNRRMREVEASILSRAPEHDLEPSSTASVR